MYAYMCVCMFVCIYICVTYEIYACICECLCVILSAGVETTPREVSFCKCMNLRTCMCVRMQRIYVRVRIYMSLYVIAFVISTCTIGLYIVCINKYMYTYICALVYSLHVCRHVCMYVHVCDAH